MLALILSILCWILIFIFIGLFKHITDNQTEIIIILRDEVIQLNKELQTMRDDRK